MKRVVLRESKSFTSSLKGHKAQFITSSMYFRDKPEAQRGVYRGLMEGPTARWHEADT